MTSARNREVWIQILELYHKEFPYLWDKSSSNYSNKTMRKDAYQVLTQIYRENFDTDASVETLKKKLENMRTTYFRELKKVKKSIRRGADEVYEPSLWYFEQLNFLSNLYESKGLRSPKPQATDPLKSEEDNADLLFQDTTQDSSDSDCTYELSTSQENTTKRKEYRKKPKISFLKQQEHQNTTTKSVPMKSEDWEVMGKSIGLQLRDISQKQLTIASKLISDAIYFAKLNRLTEESQIVIGSATATIPLCAICAAQAGD